MLLHTVWIAQLIHFQDSAAPCNLQWCSHPICDLNSGNNIEVSVLQDDLKKKHFALCCCHILLLI